MNVNAHTLYSETCKWFALVCPVAGAFSFFIDAPFGRFALKDSSILQVDGNKSWIFMEIFSPNSLITMLYNAPLAEGNDVPKLALSLKDPRSVLALCYLVHYANRAIISPARSPQRSKSHVMVVLNAILFNIVNGSLNGAYLSSPSAYTFLQSAFTRPTFWIGLGLWAAGFVGNIIHDEVLLDLRRKAQKKAEEKGDSKPHYGIPQGYLYKFISYPNYLCEWVEWAGFALAAAPVPAFSQGLLRGLTSAAPPWIFFMSEVFVMLPRAYRGHKWYHSKFPEYPKERKAVFPFLF